MLSTGVVDNLTTSDCGKDSVSFTSTIGSGWAKTTKQSLRRLILITYNTLSYICKLSEEEPTEMFFFGGCVLKLKQLHHFTVGARNRYTDQVHLLTVLASHLETLRGGRERKDFQIVFTAATKTFSECPKRVLLGKVYTFNLTSVYKQQRACKNCLFY